MYMSSKRQQICATGSLVAGDTKVYALLEQLAVRADALDIHLMIRPIKPGGRRKYMDCFVVMYQSHRQGAMSRNSGDSWDNRTFRMKVKSGKSISPPGRYPTPEGQTIEQRGDAR